MSVGISVKQGWYWFRVAQLALSQLNWSCILNLHFKRTEMIKEMISLVQVIAAMITWTGAIVMLSPIAFFCHREGVFYGFPAKSCRV